jgi:Myosin-like coiled-coil protein
MLKIREEEERRKEVATKFQTTLSEVSTLLQQNNDKNNKLREENGEMAQRLQMLCDQYTLREQHLEKLAKQYDIERQLNEAKLAKTRMEFAEDKEKTLREKQQLLIVILRFIIFHLFCPIHLKIYFCRSLLIARN